MIPSILRGDYAATPTYVPALVLSLLLAFLCGQAIAWVYMLTHRGLSYSRSFVVSLVVMAILVALVMTVLSNNLVTAFGMMAVFAIVRFRNILRDTLDTAHVLAVIVVGMACGSQKYTTALLGCAVVIAILLYLRLTDFGTRHRFDLILNLQWTRPAADLPELRKLLARHSRATACAHQRSSAAGAAMDLSYRLLLRDPERMNELVHELHEFTGVAAVSCVAAADESEM